MTCAVLSSFVVCSLLGQFVELVCEARLHLIHHLVCCLLHDLFFNVIAHLLHSSIRIVCKVDILVLILRLIAVSEHIEQATFVLVLRLLLKLPLGAKLIHVLAANRLRLALESSLSGVVVLHFEP